MLTIQQGLLLAHRSYSEFNVRVAEVECLAIDAHNYQVVAVAGTEADGLISKGGWVDVLRDARAFPWYDRRTGWGHAGFIKGAQGIVDGGLFGYLRKDRPTVLVGHSLGGAIAIDAGLMLHHMGFSVVQIMTFGSPRTLREGGVKRLAESGVQVDQWANPNDPVTKVPPRFWGYRHYKEIKTLRESPGPGIRENHLMTCYAEAFSIKLGERP
jgi:hypothetical protein